MRLFLLFVLSTLPFFASLIYFLPAEPSPWFMNLLAATKAFLFVSPILFWKFLKIPGKWTDFTKALSTEKLKRQIAIGLGLGILMSAVVLLSFEALSETTRNEMLTRVAKKISVLKIAQNFLLYGIVLSFVHSLLEEFYWRYFVFSAWKSALPPRRISLAAHLIASFAFTLHHFTVTVHYFDLSFGLLLGLGVWAAGFIWSYVFEKERSLLGVWISHIIVDIAIISIGYKALAHIP